MAYFRNGNVVTIADLKTGRTKDVPLAKVDYNGQPLELFIDNLVNQITDLKKANQQLEYKYKDLALKVSSIASTVATTNANIKLVEYDVNSLKEENE